MISFTDKVSNTVVCKLSDYKRAAQVHIDKEIVVTTDIISPTITLMNRLSVMLVKMFRVGEESSDSNRSRIIKAVTLKDTIPPPISFLWKTHKEYVGIPPTRPLCDARNGPLAQASELFTMVLEPILEVIELEEDYDSPD